VKRENMAVTEEKAFLVRFAEAAFIGFLHSALGTAIDGAT
jgi:hypothetical protein